MTKLLKDQHRVAKLSKVVLRTYNKVAMLSKDPLVFVDVARGRTAAPAKAEARSVYTPWRNHPGLGVEFPLDPCCMHAGFCEEAILAPRSPHNVGCAPRKARNRNKIEANDTNVRLFSLHGSINI